MAEVTKRSLVLSFNTDTGKTISLTINAPKEALEGTAVTTAMNTIISTGAMGDESPATSKNEAKYVIQSVEKIELV